MTVILEIMFWTSVTVVAYVYVGYPLALWLVTRRRQPLRPVAAERPSVTLVVSVFNEERCIAAKLDNCLALDYPNNRLEIVVVSDASTDGTDSIVESYANQGIRLLHMERRGGKTLGLNAAVESASGDIVVFSDANAMYWRGAIEALAAHFSDPSVGAVIGESRYVEPESDAGRSESLYWDYERTIKRLESRNGSVVGGDGAIYAVRKTLYTPMSADTISDFANPLQVVRAGYRCLYEPAAFSWEATAEGFSKEFDRKVRIVNRAWRALMSMKDLLNPLRFGWFAWQLLSHKLLRWLVPLFLAVAFISNALLVGTHPAYSVSVAAQLLFYGLATAGALMDERDGLAKLVYIPYYFCLVNFASVKGILEAYRGKTYATWSTARADS